MKREPPVLYLWCLLGDQWVQNLTYNYIMDLTKKKCEPCEGGTKPFGSEEIETYMTYLKTLWEVSEDLKKIERKFKFKDFKEAMGFVNKIAELAEQEGH